MTVALHRTPIFLLGDAHIWYIMYMRGRSAFQYAHSFIVRGLIVFTAGRVLVDLILTYNAHECGCIGNEFCLYYLSRRGSFPFNMYYCAIRSTWWLIPRGFSLVLWLQDLSHFHGYPWEWAIWINSNNSADSYRFADDAGAEIGPCSNLSVFASVAAVLTSHW